MVTLQHNTNGGSLTVKVFIQTEVWLEYWIIWQNNSNFVPREKYLSANHQFVWAYKGQNLSLTDRYVNVSFTHLSFILQKNDFFFCLFIICGKWNILLW